MEFKDGVDINDLKKLQPAMWQILSFAVCYCAEYRLPLVITSLINDRDGVKASSKTHEQGRAIDISVAGWTDQHIHRFCFQVNAKFFDIAALSASDMKPRAAIYHNSGYGDHIHLQVRPDAPFNLTL